MADQQATIHGRLEVFQRLDILGEPTEAEPAWLGAQETQAGRWRPGANEGRQADPAIAGNQGGHPLGDLESHRRMREQRPVVMGMCVDKSRRHNLAHRLNDALRPRRGQGPIAAIWSPLTPMSAANREPPVPSMMVPPRMRMSKASGSTMVDELQEPSIGLWGELLAATAAAEVFPLRSHPDATRFQRRTAEAEFFAHY